MKELDKGYLEKQEEMKRRQEQLAEQLRQAEETAKAK